MKTIEYKTRDRSEWGSGPWDNEPDKVQFIEPQTGLPALAVRNLSGNWCGYVGVDSSHPYYEKDFYDCLCDPACEDYWGDDCNKISYAIDVHGDVTFANRCNDSEEFPVSERICHIVEPGESDDVWWIGFDTMHAWDLSPNMGSRYEASDQIYRSLSYVKNQISKMAVQLQEIGNETQ